MALALELSAEWVILAEGLADCNFFSKLTTKRAGFPKFDIIPVNGRPGYCEYLKGLRGDAAAFRALKGILLIADSADSPNDVFTELCDQIKCAGGYGIPNGLLQLGNAPGYHALSVMLLPDEFTPGSLEGLLAREIDARREWLRTCVETYLRCGQTNAMTWSAEKRDKAIFHCMIAATNEDDPSKAASWVFKDPKPVVEIDASCFDDVERRIKAFCAAVEAAL